MNQIFLRHRIFICVAPDIFLLSTYDLKICIFSSGIDIKATAIIVDRRFVMASLFPDRASYFLNLPVATFLPKRR
jgi:hypothetical protein